MVQLHNFFITSMVVPCGTAAPVLLKWFVSRDVPTGAPSSNGTIIPIPIPAFPLLVYLHSRKFIRSMDGATKSGVLVSRALFYLLPTDGRSSSETRAARNAFFRSSFPSSRIQGELLIFRIFLRCAPFTIHSYSLFYLTTRRMNRSAKNKNKLGESIRSS